MASPLARRSRPSWSLFAGKVTKRMHLLWDCLCHTSFLHNLMAHKVSHSLDRRYCLFLTIIIIFLKAISSFAFRCPLVMGSEVHKEGCVWFRLATTWLACIYAYAPIYLYYPQKRRFLTLLLFGSVWTISKVGHDSSRPVTLLHGHSTISVDNGGHCRIRYFSVVEAMILLIDAWTKWYWLLAPAVSPSCPGRIYSAQSIVIYAPVKERSKFKLACARQHIRTCIPWVRFWISCGHRCC